MSFKIFSAYDEIVWDFRSFDAFGGALVNVSLSSFLNFHNC